MTFRIPLAGPSIGADEEHAVLETLRSGRLAQGPQVAAFEEELAAACGRRWAVAVSSGTAALHLALIAAGVGPGQTMRVPAFTFPATANVVRLVGAHVELVDVNAATWCMRLPDKLSSAARSMPVHQFGFPAKVFPGDISDAACAVGVPSAMQGLLACLSFHPRKVLTTGEGGAILGDDAALLQELRLLRSHGLHQAPPSEGRYAGDFQLVRPGYNYRMSDLAAALGRVQLRRLPSLLAERRALAGRYRERLAGSRVTLQADTPARAWQTLAVLLPEAHPRAGERDAALQRDRLRAGLAATGIETQIASYGLHRLAAYAADRSSFPVADALHDRALALPLRNGMPLADVDLVCDALLAAMQHDAPAAAIEASSAMLPEPAPDPGAEIVQP